MAGGATIATIDLADALLREHERRGLIQWAAVTLALTLLFAAMTPFLFAVPGVRLRMYLAMAIIIGAAALALWLIWRGRALDLVGYGFSLVTILFLALAPAANYLGQGPEQVAPAIMMKGAQTVATPLFIALAGLTMQPRYPVIVAAGGVAIELVLLWIVVIDPRTVMSRDISSALMGPAFNPDRVAIDLLIFVMTGVAMAVLTWSARRTVREAVRLEKANRQLSRYFSPNVVAGIAGADAAFLKLGGRRQDVVVMFADLRDFTALSSTLSAEETVALLSDYHERMVAEIFRAGGTLDKFIGDGIMATFGTPEAAADDADRAVAAGIAMKRALDAFNRESVARGRPRLGQGIGIHCGPAIVGNIGTPERLEFTTIGATVNVASRIERACKTTGADFLISDAVKARLTRPVALHALPPTRLPGVPEAIGLHAVLTEQPPAAPLGSAAPGGGGATPGRPDRF
jgi:adenylate cyclase